MALWERFNETINKGFKPFFLCVELVKILSFFALGIETMCKKVTLDYYNNDPLVVVTLINPILNTTEKALAYLDTGSDAVVIPKYLWSKLGLRDEYRTVISAVNSTCVGWCTFIDLEFLKNKHKTLKFL